MSREHSAAEGLLALTVWQEPSANRWIPPL
jgi:hypothetical protein